MDAWLHLLHNCVDVYRNNILILYDETTANLVESIVKTAKSMKKNVETVGLKMALCHGEEPPDFIRAKMLACDVIICMTAYSMAHTNARKNAMDHGVAFLSMPEYKESILNNRAIFVDYASKLPQVRQYADLLTSGSKIAVETKKGTKLYMNIVNRRGNCCPGLINQDYLLGSPPDIEANIAPIEGETNGRLVVDGSITDQNIGLLDAPVILDIQDGSIIQISSRNKCVENKVREIFANVDSSKAYILGEFGIGFNDCADLCGNMLIDEGTMGCVHFGMGSNWTIGGKNKVGFHLDFVLRNATVKIDERVVIDRGELIYAV